MRQVTVAVEGLEDWMDSVLSRKNLSVRLVNCRPYGKSGMLQHVEICTKGNIDEIISSIKSNPNVLESDFAKTDRSRARGLIVTKNSPVCRCISELKGFCTACVLGADQHHGHWRILVSGTNSLDQLLTGLESKGISIREVESNPPTNGILTLDQQNIMKIAEQEGFFEFPRRITLTRLATRLHMSKSNLEEILRRAERKVASHYVSGFNEA